LAFGGKSLYKVACDGHVVRYVGGKEWEEMGSVGALNLAVDGEGGVWVISYFKTVRRWDGREWEDMGLSNVTSIAAGPTNQVYAISGPQILQFTNKKWTVQTHLPAQEIAVGSDKLYLIRGKQIFEQQPECAQQR
jgi:hypothetical protein